MRWKHQSRTSLSRRVGGIRFPHHTGDGIQDNIKSQRTHSLDRLVLFLLRVALEEETSSQFDKLSERIIKKVIDKETSILVTLTAAGVYPTRAKSALRASPPWRPQSVVRRDTRI